MGEWRVAEGLPYRDLLAAAEIVVRCSLLKLLLHGLGELLHMRSITMLDLAMVDDVLNRRAQDLCVMLISLETEHTQHHGRVVRASQSAG